MEFLQSETMNWQEQFKMMKRWYYRLRGSNDIFGRTISHQEDFFLAFFNCCHHFKNWLVINGVASDKDTNGYIDKKESLKLCADICTFSKHAEITRTSRTGDFETKAVGQMYSVILPSGTSYIASRLKVESGGKVYYDAFKIVEECINDWGQFILSKSLEIPDMPEEHIFQNFVKWQPDPLK